MNFTPYLYQIRTLSNNIKFVSGRCLFFTIFLLSANLVNYFKKLFTEK